MDQVGWVVEEVTLALDIGAYNRENNRADKRADNRADNRVDNHVENEWSG